MKTLKFARIAATTLALVAGGAHSALITSWDITDVAGFVPSSVLPGGNLAPNPVLSNSDRSLDWGVAGTVNGQSGLDIVNMPTITTLLGVPVTTVSVTHRNWPIFAPSLSAVDIFATIVLNPTGYVPPPNVVDGGITFKVKFLETPNLASGNICPDGSIAGSNGCPDLFLINNEGTNFSFAVDDYLYTVDFIGTGFFSLSNAACAAVGAASGCRGFETPENAATTANFSVEINASKIPEPGSLALLGLGLLGLGAARRRTSAK